MNSFPSARQIRKLDNPVHALGRVLAARPARGRARLPSTTRDVDVRVDARGRAAARPPRAIRRRAARWRAGSPCRPRGRATARRRSAMSSSSSVWNARSASVTRSSTSSTSCRCRIHESTGSAASMDERRQRPDAVNFARTVVRRKGMDSGPSYRKTVAESVPRSARRPRALAPSRGRRVEELRVHGRARPMVRRARGWPSRVPPLSFSPGTILCARRR